MRILNVAEKPSVSKSITNVLSTNTQTLRALHKYTPVYSFTHPFRNTSCEFLFTSVLGHVFNIDFKDKRKWDAFDPVELFHSELEKSVTEVNIVKNIQNYAKNADMVIIWTDCDREGENIANEIRDIVLHRIGATSRKAAPPRLIIKRARFFGISRQEIGNALENLVDINDLESDAVSARMELDLRIGAAFTRLQTLNLRFYFSDTISYGPCQIPTLGFVVERNDQIENFVPEKGYGLEFLVKWKDENKARPMLSHSNRRTMDRENKSYVQNDENKARTMLSHSNRRTGDRENKSNLQNDEHPTDKFLWKRNTIFDRNCVIRFYDLLKTKIPVVLKNQKNTIERFKPLPLRTVELQKKMASFYKMPSHKVMEIAESLYNKGYISYPRTETDSFEFKFAHSKVVDELKKDSVLGSYASELKIQHPRRGKNNDAAHLPIYPVRDGNGISNHEHRSIYEFVARRYLACLSENAKGIENVVEIGFGRDEDKNICKRRDSAHYRDGSYRKGDSAHDRNGSYRKGDSEYNRDGNSEYNRDGNNEYTREDDSEYTREGNNKCTRYGNNECTRYGDNDPNTNHTLTHPGFEIFKCTGVKIIKKNFLEIYFYDKWEERNIYGEYEVGQSIKNGILDLTESVTSPPSLLTESELISLMDKNGIGTDATIHEHIKKIQDRKYFQKINNLIKPLPLGIGLIKGYQHFQLDFSKPTLRKNLECRLKDICENKADFNSVIEGQIEAYKEMYSIIKENIESFKETVVKSVEDRKNTRLGGNNSRLNRNSGRLGGNNNGSDGNNNGSHGCNTGSDGNFNGSHANNNRVTRNENGSHANNNGFTRNDNGFTRNDNGSHANNNRFARNDNGSHANNNGFTRNDNGFTRNDNGFTRNDNGSHGHFNGLNPTNNRSHANNNRVTRNDNGSHANNNEFTRNDNRSHADNNGSHANNNRSHANNNGFNPINNKFDEDGSDDDIIVAKKQRRNAGENRSAEEFGSMKVSRKTKENVKRDNRSSENKTNTLRSNIQDLPEAQLNFKCKCRQPAKRFTVSKENPNKGRTFFSCGSFPKRCDLFVWLEDVDVLGNINHMEIENLKSSENCKCGFEPKASVAHTDANKGRVYFKCKKSYKPCDFFKWRDE